MPAGSSRSSTRPRSQPCCIVINMSRVASGDRASTSGAALSAACLTAALPIGSQLRCQAGLGDTDGHPEMTARRRHAGCLLTTPYPRRGGKRVPARPVLSPPDRGSTKKASGQGALVSASRRGLSTGAGGGTSGPCGSVCAYSHGARGRDRGAGGRSLLVTACRVGIGASARRGRGQPVPAGHAEWRQRPGQVGTTGPLAICGPVALASGQPGLFLAHDDAEWQQQDGRGAAVHGLPQ